LQNQQNLKKLPARQNHAPFYKLSTFVFQARFGTSELKKNNKIKHLDQKKFDENVFLEQAYTCCLPNKKNFFSRQKFRKDQKPTLPLPIMNKISKFCPLVARSKPRIKK
jgi:hypothetical protein